VFERTWGFKSPLAHESDLQPGAATANSVRQQKTQKDCKENWNCNEHSRQGGRGLEFSNYNSQGKSCWFPVCKFCNSVLSIVNVIGHLNHDSDKFPNKIDRSTPP